MKNHSDIYAYLVTHVKGYYDAFDGGHNTKHFIEVFAAAQEIANYLEMNEDDKMIVMIAAAFHDTGRLIEDKRHEEFSVIIFNNDKNMQRWLTKDERQIISNTINEHRSAKGASSVYSKVLKDADKVSLTNRERLIERVVGYNTDHCALDQTDPLFIDTVTRKVIERLGKTKANRSWQLECTRELYGDKPNFDIPSEEEVAEFIQNYIKRR